MNHEEGLDLLRAVKEELLKANISFLELKAISTMYFAVPTIVSVVELEQEIHKELSLLKKLLTAIKSRNDLIYETIEDNFLKPNVIKEIDQTIKKSKKISLILDGKLSTINKKGAPFKDFGTACCAYYFMELLCSKDPENNISQKKKLEIINNILALFDIPIPSRLDKSISNFHNYLLNNNAYKEAFDELYDKVLRQ